MTATTDMISRILRNKAKLSMAKRVGSSGTTTPQVEAEITPSGEVKPLDRREERGCPGKRPSRLLQMVAGNTPVLRAAHESPVYEASQTEPNKAEEQVAESTENSSSGFQTDRVGFGGGGGPVGSGGFSPTKMNFG